MKKIFLLTFVFSLLFISYVRADYSREYKQAYSWAYNNWVTTMSTIDKANLYWNITRIELAKMISNFAINVLKKPLRETSGCKFDDITSALDKQYDNWVSNACAMRLMWQWIKKFRPYDKVTVAEFWTILSRLLHDIQFNSYWNDPFYLYHLKALKYWWIMADTSNPTWKNAIRGDVMSMLRKSEMWGDYNLIKKAYQNEWFKILYASNYKDWQKIVWDKVLYVNEKYWYAIELWEDMNWWYLKHSTEIHPFESYSAFWDPDEESDVSSEPVDTKFDWEEWIDLYSSDWRRPASILVHKFSGAKKPSNCTYRNNKYCVSVGVDMGVDVGLVYLHFNMFEVK